MIGYIVLVFGYVVDSKNNDVSILKYMIYYNVDEIQKVVLRGGCVCIGLWCF